MNTKKIYLYLPLLLRCINVYIKTKNADIRKTGKIPSITFIHIDYYISGIEYFIHTYKHRHLHLYKYYKNGKLILIIHQHIYKLSCFFSIIK